MGPERLITYCGLYGGCCARYKGYRAFRQAAEIVAEICDAHGFHYWMPHVVSEFSYEEFRKGVEFFRRDDTWFTCEGCCKGGGGGPPGCVRACCKERGVEVCFECADFPCERVAEDTAMLARAEEYRRLGREEWLSRQVERADRGFEHHTRWCYRIEMEPEKAEGG
ncbi:MAG: DUF3795 domain-containing protein [Armatimonadetes bacterium]|nr:DUF3795 domain-containing protein [Armatimonadota bacterium]